MKIRGLFLFWLTPCPPHPEEKDVDKIFLVCFSRSREEAAFQSEERLSGILPLSRNTFEKSNLQGAKTKSQKGSRLW